MPELPEVETLVKQLKKRILHQKIVDLEIIDSKVVDSRIKNILPIKINKIWRKAKSIIFELENNHYLLIHLRMTGHFHHVPRGEENQLRPFNRFMVAKFYLNDGSILTHNSLRKFGRIRLVNKEELQQGLNKLGIEPLSKEFTLSQFRNILLKKKRTKIKALLMDQSVIGGIGNIYALEVLYHAGVNPNRKGESLSAQEIKKIFNNIKKILKLAVKNNGTTVETYVHIEGTGGFQKYLAVYQRKKCPKGHLIEKIVQGGRGTYYCPQCQV